MGRAVNKIVREVYRSETAGRCFFTKKAAVRAEAKARVSKRFPVEAPEHDDYGRITYPGFSLPDEEYWAMVRQEMEAIKKELLAEGAA